MREALKKGDWSSCVKIAWADAWEMHSLFHTSEVPFTYWKPESVDLLKKFARFYQEAASHEALPLVTLDAGPNVHVTVPRSHSAEWERKLLSWVGIDRLLKDEAGAGISWWT